MELAEVKKYFENAEKVKCLSSGRIVNISKKITRDVHLWNGGFWIDFDEEYYKQKSVKLYDNGFGFAKILTTKEPSFSITKEQLRELTDPKVKQWFPEVFNLSKDFTGWVKTKGELNKKWICYFENGFQKYGICSDGNWFTQNIKVRINGNEFEATEQEVFEALKNEAAKRGFVEGAFVKTLHNTEKKVKADLKFSINENKLISFFDYDGMSGLIFQKGNWSTIIPTITKSEAEKLLNKKIID